LLPTFCETNRKGQAIYGNISVETVEIRESSPAAEEEDDSAKSSFGDRILMRESG